MKKTAIFIASIFIFFSGIFVSPAPLVNAQVTPVPNSVNIKTNIEGALNVGCSNEVNPFSANCLLFFFYSIILEPSFWILGLGANILDFFLGYSLDSNAYTADFIQKGWGLIRDISNVAFIFTLLYLAIRHILGMSAKKAIPTLVVVALLLNFSLFFTKVVIDAGNILARAFYNSIVIENDTNYGSVEGYKSITFGLVDKINPQNLLSEGLFRATSVNCQYSTETGSCVGEATPNLDDKTGTVFAVLILMVIVNLVLTWTFVSVALLFVGRVIGLWFSMIFSPIAFVTLAVPGSGGFLKQLSFDTWKDNVLKLAFVAPVFIFFLYLTISFLDIIFRVGVPAAEGGDPFIKLMGIFIPFIFIIFLLITAKKISESMAGDFGGMVKSVVGKLAGVVGGVALGGTAMLGRKAIGGFATAQLKGGNYEKRIADAQASGRKGEARRLMNAQKSLLKLQDSSFDVRNAAKSKGVVGWASRGVGAGLNAGMTGFGGKDFNVGKGSDQSRKKYEDSAEKEKLKRAEELSTIQFGERAELEENIRRKAKEEQKTLPELKKRKEMEIHEEYDRVGNDKTLSEDQKKKKYKELEDSMSNLNETFKKMDKDLDKQIKKPLDWEKDRRRNLYADDVENNQTWYNFRTEGNAARTADRIRKGDKAKDENEKLIDQIKKVTKKDEDDEDKSEPDKPKDEPKPEPEKPKDDESK